MTALNPQKDYPVKVFLIEEFFWVENEMELNEKQLLPYSTSHGKWQQKCQKGKNLEHF